MMEDGRKQMIRRLHEEAWERGEFGVIDELYATDYQGPLPGSPAGPEGERQHVAMIRSTFSDLEMRIDDLVAEGETVVLRGSMSGTDTGGFMGRAPTGRRVTFWGVTVYHFSGERISASWTGADMLGLLIQLGVVPSPWPDEEPASASA